MTQLQKPTTCPYCSESNLIARVLSLPSVPDTSPHYDRVGPYLHGPGRGSTRAGYWVRTYTDKQLSERLQGFTVKLIGTEVPERIIDFPPGPFFQTTTDRLKPGAPWRHGLYFAYRMTHTNSDLAIDVHWWPDHGRIVTLRGIPEEGMRPVDLEVVNEGLKLLRKETRGAPKISEPELIAAIQKQGEGASQRRVAKSLRISDSTLRYWLTSKGKTWPVFKQEALNAVLM